MHSVSKLEKERIAQRQGDAFQSGVDAMKEIAHSFSSIQHDDYIVSVAVEEAEGYYVRNDSDLVWKVPRKDENAHIEVVVQDSNDRRFVPNLDVYVELRSDTSNIGKKQHEFIWHPFLYHYGENWSVPQKGRYKVQVSVMPPDFRRHDEVYGKRYPTQFFQVEFQSIEIDPGRKPHGPE